MEWNDEEWIHPNDFNLTGLLPHGEAAVMRMLDPERWAKAEERTEELIARIQPNQYSEVHRRAIASYVQRLIMESIPCLVCTYGSVPLKTYLPDGDIDLTAFSINQSLSDWATEVRDLLKKEEKNDGAEFQIREVQYVKAEVKLVKCLVDNVVVDISFNQLSGLGTFCFLEEVDHLIGRNHLFKRSILLIKAWCYYESRLLGAYHGLISTYALETLVLYIFQVFNNSFAGPLEVLYRFLEFFSKFDWGNFCVCLWGPVPIRSLPNATAEPPRKDGQELLLSKSFLDACCMFYSVYPRNYENPEQAFIPKFLNIIDPLRVDNNLGRCVSKGNFYRIRSAFAFGAQRLARLMDCSKQDVGDELNQFFMNTLDRHGKVSRPDTHIQGGYYVKLEDSEQIDQKSSGMKMSSLSSEADDKNLQGVKDIMWSLDKKVRSSRDDALESKVPIPHQFARTNSSPELSEVPVQDHIVAGRERLQDPPSSNFFLRTHGSRAGDNCNRNVGVADASLRQNTSQKRYDDGGSDIDDNSMGPKWDIGDCCKGEELPSTDEPMVVQISTNMLPLSRVHNIGPIHLPVSILPSMIGQAHQNLLSMTTPKFPSFEAQWSPHVLPSGALPLSFTANGIGIEQEELDKRDDNDDSEQCFWDYEADLSTEHNDEVVLDEGHQSIQQLKHGTRDGLDKENGEIVGGNYRDDRGFSPGKSIRDERGWKTAHLMDIDPLGSKNISNCEGSNMVSNDKMQFANTIIPNPNWVLPVDAERQNHPVFWQMARSSNQPVLPIQVYPVGLQGPLFNMVPVCNLPTKTHNSGASSNWFKKEGLNPSIVQLGQIPDTVADSGELFLVEDDSGKISEESVSDILTGDFVSHWQNLQYGRHCQNFQLQVPSMYPPLMYFQGHLPSYDEFKLQSSLVGDCYAEPRLNPGSVYRYNESRSGGRLRHHGGRSPMHRSGTGTYLPNQSNIGDQQSVSPRYYRTNSRDKKEHHRDKETKWSSNSKPRFGGHSHFRSEKNAGVGRPVAGSGKIERRRNGFWNAPSYQSYNGVTVSSSGGVDEYPRYWDRK